MSHALVIEGVSKSFKGSRAPALDAVSLTLAAGSCTAVLGPSGSGKSTLLRAVAGLETPDTGRVLLDGLDLAAVRPERRGMAMVFQRPLLFPHLNVLDNVAFAAIVSGVPRKEARRDAQAFLELVQMEEAGKRTVKDLSGGQQQRVAIARGLAARPAVLLLDEPFSALDPELRSAMHELLAQVRKKLNPTILMVTHDRDEAADVADHLALISEGRVLQHSTVEAMYCRPASLQVSRLMGGVNEVPGTVREGIHYSALGAHPLPDDQTWPEGPATLVVRQEHIIISDERGQGTPAVITGVHTRGPRQLISMDAKGAALHAEASGSQSLTVGGTVRIQLPTPSLTVIGLAAEPSAQPLPSPNWKVLA
ncbi:ABC transporter ATP-binding protein [Pseudarthrobacter sp. NS4]|uniref:ABC transporter ATP-binding protein n=1 Tax=Pseudarthrobacter sp. NS4 TaxID=2973976 RepID=UPI00216341C4|nr:ABC transporter ATP-binding protein [Pseudarthrobacter sp. NS4]